MAVADETAQIMEYSSQLEAKSEELARTARQLREANEMLQKLSSRRTLPQPDQPRAAHADDLDPRLLGDPDGCRDDRRGATATPASSTTKASG
jgi:hypothetical protein